MRSAFADSEFDDPVETQLTLGTLSLLGIFFALVVVCGIFFGFGYSMGRRTAAPLSAGSRPDPRPAFKVAPSKHDAVTTSASSLTLSSPQVNDQVASLEPASTSTLVLPALHKATVTRTERSAVRSTAAMEGTSTPALPRASAAASAITAPGSSQGNVSGDDAAVLQAHDHIAKPSAILPQTTASLNTPTPYFVWTPPFDVHRKPAARVHLTPSALSISRPSITLQIAALSREDDAEVLASALRKSGYTPSVHSTKEDALYHVQLGPLDRTAALAAKQRLVARGYQVVMR